MAFELIFLCYLHFVRRQYSELRIMNEINTFNLYVNQLKNTNWT